MTTKAHAYVVHPAQGGLDTMTAPTQLQPGELQTAENCEYFNPGSKKKRLGTVRHSSQLTTGGSPVIIRAIADFWHDPAIDPSHMQHLVGAGSGVFLTNPGAASGNWSVATATAFGDASTYYNIVIAQSYAVFSHALSTQKPVKYDGATFSDLSACTPKWQFATHHLSRLWASGVWSDTNRVRSTVYLSAAGNITDWDGEDAASLVFDDGDGDVVMGLSKPFRGAIYVFKGPYYGSIHVITGRTMRQFTRDKIMDAAPCYGHRTIVTTPNDIYWLSPYGIHSLLATTKYGNTEEAYVSHKIKNLWPRLEQTALVGSCAFYHPTRNLIGWFVPEAGSTENTMGLIFNYALGHWAIWRYGFNVASCMVARDPTTAVPRLFLGGYDGYVRAGDAPLLVDDGADAYTMRVKFPNLIRLGESMSELTEKSFQSVTTFFNPVASDSTAELNVSVDGRLQTFSVALQATGGEFGEGTFEEAVFGGNDGLYYTETPLHERGRAIQLEYVNAVAGADLDIYGYAIRAVPAEAIAMEGSG